MKKLQEIIRNNFILFLIVVLFLNILFLIITLEYKNTEINKLDEELKYTQENLDLEKKKSKIEIIKDQIDNTKNLQEELNKKYNQAKKNKEANVWFLRCLETEGELELKGDKYDLECYNYKNEEDYKKLQRFASYNLQKTRNELGLQ